MCEVFFFKSLFPSTFFFFGIFYKFTENFFAFDCHVQLCLSVIMKLMRRQSLNS